WRPGIPHRATRSRSSPKSSGGRELHPSIAAPAWEVTGERDERAPPSRALGRSPDADAGDPRRRRPGRRDQARRAGRAPPLDRPEVPVVVAGSGPARNRAWGSDRDPPGHGGEARDRQAEKRRSPDPLRV